MMNTIRQYSGSYCFQSNYGQSVGANFISEVKQLISIIFYIYFSDSHIFRLLDNTAKKQQLGEARSIFPVWLGVMLPTYSYFMMKGCTCWQEALTITAL